VSFVRRLVLIASVRQLILADKFDPYKLVYEGCLVFNPGSFARRRFGWSTYYPQMVEPKERMEERYTSLTLFACLELIMMFRSTRSELPGPDD
jgi:hypothetical protein